MLAVLVVLALAFTVASAALKPLEKKQKFEYSKHIFVGKVISLETKDLTKAPRFPDWVTRHHKLTVEISRVGRTTKHTHTNPSHPADETLPEAGSSVHVMLWRAVSRPDTFNGDTGAGLVPEVGKSYTFFAHFLHHDPNLRHMYHESFPHVEEEGMKAYNVLMPNGIGDEGEMNDDRFEL